MDYEKKIKEINIILDEKDPQNPIFVEIEDSRGYSINIGQRSPIPGGLTKLKITLEEFESL